MNRMFPQLQNKSAFDMIKAIHQHSFHHPRFNVDAGREHRKEQGCYFLKFPLKSHWPFVPKLRRPNPQKNIRHVETLWNSPASSPHPPQNSDILILQNANNTLKSFPFLCVICNTLMYSVSWIQYTQVSYCGRGWVLDNDGVIFIHKRQATGRFLSTKGKRESKWWVWWEEKEQN